jgi:TRAP transporter TAXI family solute receptor
MRFLFLFGAIASTVTLLFLSGCSEPGEKVDYIKIGTGSQVGVYYTAGLAVAELLNDQSSTHTYDLSVDATDGSVFNINAVATNALDLGFSQADQLYLAYNGLSKWKDHPQKNLRFVCSFHSELVTLVASQESEIHHIIDLKGKMVSIGSPSSGTRENALHVLAHEELVPGQDFKVESLKASEAALMLQDGRIDAFFYTVGHPSGALIEATNGARPVRFIPISGMLALIKTLPYYQKDLIPISLYPQALNEHPVPTISMLTTLVTSADADDEMIYRVTKTIFENLETIRTRHPSFAGLSQKGMLRGDFAPMHPGAKRYFEEKGLIAR